MESLHITKSIYALKKKRHSKKILAALVKCIIDDSIQNMQKLLVVKKEMIRLASKNRKVYNSDGTFYSEPEFETEECCAIEQNYFTDEELEQLKCEYNSLEQDLIYQMKRRMQLESVV